MVRHGVLRLIIALIIICLVGSSFNPVVQANQGSNAPELLSITQQFIENQATLPTGFQLISSSATSLVLDIQTPPYSFVTESDGGQSCQALKADGYIQSGIPGEPELLSAGVMFGIPLETTPTFSIRSIDTVTLPGKIHLCPVATPIFQQDQIGLVVDQGEVLKENPVSYARDAFTPAQPVELAISGMIRSQRVARLSIKPFHYNPATDEIRVIRHMVVEAQFVSDDFTGSAMGLVNEGSFESLLQKTLINYDQSRYWRLLTEHTPSTIIKSIPSISVDSPAYKIKVDQDGLYQVTYSDLQVAGVPVEGIDPRTFRLLNQGVEIPIYVIGEEDGEFNLDDYFLFLGQKISTKFTNTNVYWLSWGVGYGLRMSTQDGTVHGTDTPDSFEATLHLEEDHLYIKNTPSGLINDYWYWFLLNAYSGPVSQDFTFSLQNIDFNSPIATVNGLLKGYYADPQHHTLIFLNGNPIDDHTWSAGSEYAFSINVPVSYLLDGINTLTITCPYDGNITIDMQLVNWLEIDYSHTYTAENDLLGFTQPDQWQFQVSGFITSTLGVFEVTNPFAPVRILGGEIIPDGSLYQMNFEQDFSGDHSYLVLSPPSWLIPVVITEDVPSNLKDPNNGADYIIISHTDFLDAIQPLATYRSGHGFHPMVVDVQDVYDEFNGGVFDPQAIQSFLAYAYSYWSTPAPAFVLLVGDGHYDFKNNNGNSGPDFIPPFLGEYDPWTGETASDNRYVTISGDDILPDMYIGRLPTSSVAETTSMVEKILTYDQTPIPGDWNTHLTFVADNADAGGDFPVHSDLIADNYLPIDYTSEKIYYGLPPYENAADAQAAIVNSINQGRLIIHYTGHGSVAFWASEKLLEVSSIGNLTNIGMYPLFLPMTCQEGYFINPNYPSLAESLVRASEKGAIASFSPAGFGLASGHDVLAQGIYQAFFNNGFIQFGAATTFAKYFLAANGPGYIDLIDTYLLFGDPATQLKISPTAVLVSFTGKAQPGTIQLNWETVNELWLVGFNLYRSESPDGIMQKLNSDLILAKKPGQMAGDLYEYYDTVDPGINYFYWIELVQVYGRNLVGPISVIVSFMINLPVVVR
jgi:hypothetical protein